MCGVFAVALETKEVSLPPRCLFTLFFPLSESGQVLDPSASREFPRGAARTEKHGRLLVCFTVLSVWLFLDKFDTPHLVFPCRIKSSQFSCFSKSADMSSTVIKETILPNSF